MEIATVSEVFNQVFRMVGPWFWFPIFLAFTVGILRVVRNALGMDDEENKIEIIKRANLDYQKADLAEAIPEWPSPPKPPAVDNDHCQYCGGRLEKLWHKCPNCGAPRR
jgi:hypothetical protein